MPITTRLSDWFINLSRRQKTLVRVVGFLALLVILLFVFVLPLKSVPLETPIATGSPQATTASHAFWEAFHADNWTALPEVIEELTAAYATDSEDPNLTTLLAAAHLWRFQARNHFNKSAEDLKEDLRLTAQYARETERLRANDSDRTRKSPTIIATAMYQLGVVNNDSSEQIQAHMDLLANTQVYPEFAAWVQGWILSAFLPADNPRWPEANLGFEGMLDSCAGFRVSETTKFNRFIHSLYSLKTYFYDQVCYNNPVAPHGIEGAFLAIGDMYLKAGNMDMAQLWYENTKTSPTYGSWQFSEQLDFRLANMEALARKFADDTGKLNVSEPAMSFQSEIACVVCHAR